MEENKSLPQVKYCKRLILLHLKHITLKSVKRCSKTYRNRSILGEVCKINRKLQHRFIKKVMEIYVYFFFHHRLNATHLYFNKYKKKCR